MKNNYIKELNLLYVEDDQSIREILSLKLERLVKNLHIAIDGEDGYSKFVKHKPDLILTDITMPKLNGIEMTQKIREVNSDIPIIVISAHTDVDFFIDSINCGVTAYLLKPINKNKLLDSLELNAKNIYLNKINSLQQKKIQEQQSILQNIIDSQENISFVTDFNKLSFVNLAFLNFFDVSSIEKFEEKFERVEDIFMQNSDYVHKKIVSNYSNIDKSSFRKNFFNEVNNLNDEKKVVLIKSKDNEQKSFYLTISLLDTNKELYLLNLTDITSIKNERFLIEKKAYHDGLTNLYNRHKFDELFEKELSRVKRYEHPLSMAILDIDHFKVFNDKYGHLKGDEILIKIANSLKPQLRKTDIFARWGGEEFVILFIETTLENAVQCSNNIRKNIENIKHDLDTKVTVSFGVCEYKDNDTPDSFFQRCDKALYSAKEKGRNRVESS
ncbi:GGDEF domain-containing response regulator [Poseidonibacter ostreae]|jgi:two-component system, cell cycle response regulator|uniref:diguanylate cyclase n=1 Tax=Poseidonibacter ostreae TaxID=2654171 RepID=A0A6L4WRT9_9BACT|nr:diguanylate cyclase [Poseidonibacter ostreae]KAB7887544.1 diguanylate cyclase [Poseidonibacter ostreae]KAB7888397.1 diguanylate cyclase [Poseidonibacter ostreae]KAB7888662.1 diguanylate cyclase [Poseidonibacter ostreae]MAC84490.1 diguanylate cyclase response regulator [Arcobacter sp.]|tara:strand:+ start:6202 stop:7527 length:1326 start_codon:yes stop_codon:yes gene_type:complete